MTNFIPGKIIKTCVNKKLQDIIIRYPKWEDLSEMIVYINSLSQEDIFITYAKETITKEGEMLYLTEMFKAMEVGNSIYLACFFKNALIGSCTVMRDMQSRKRSFHVGILGITIAKEYRNTGIGEVLVKTALEEAKKNILGLKIITLNVYSPNITARHLYKKLGFVECGRIPKGVWYKGDYIDEIKMFKNV